MSPSREVVLAAMRSAPAEGYVLQPLPAEIPVTVFAGYFGFGPRAGRPQLPSIGLVPPPLFAHFDRAHNSEPHGVSKMAALFNDEESAAAAAQLLGQRAREVLVAEDAPDLVDVEGVSIGDEVAWAWQMTVATKQGQARTDVGWRRGRWVLNLLSWSRTAPAKAATLEMALGLDAALGRRG